MIDLHRSSSSSSIEAPASSSSSERDASHSLRDLLTGFVAGFGLLVGVAYLDETFLRPVPPDVSIGGALDHRRLQEASAPLDFREIATRTGTDKVWGVNAWDKCKHAPETCNNRPQVENPKCRVLQGHFYHTIYNNWLAEDYAGPDAQPFQFLEIGFYNGRGFDAYREFMPRAEHHSIEIACLPEGPQAEGKWPHGNFAKVNPRYQQYLDSNTLHCGDGSKLRYLHEVWTTLMKRPDAPPLKVVVEDASHLAKHMAQSLFFWFPRIEPGGLLIVEDVQPIQEANLFRTNVLPQVLKDLHYCGGDKPEWLKDRPCFPTIWPLLHSVHCEMHICVFERNEQPAIEYDMDLSLNPPHALHAYECLLNSNS